MSEDPHAPVAWFEYATDLGIDEAGHPMPIQEIGLSIPMPQIAAGGLVLPTAANRLVVTQADKLDGDTIVRIIPGTRLVETSSPFIADGLLESGQFVAVDKPTKARVDKARGETRAHVDERAQRDQRVAAGDEPAPDATDPPAGEEQIS